MMWADWGKGGQEITTKKECPEKKHDKITL